MAKEDRKEFKDTLIELKGDFLLAIKDKKRWLFGFIEIAIVAVIVLFDLLTKKYIYGYCAAEGDIIVIKNVFRFTAVQNTGASFGIFKDKTTILTIIITLKICKTKMYNIG